MARKRLLRPREVQYATIAGGRQDRSGKACDLFVRIEQGDRGTAISLGSASDKLQLRCTVKALREALRLAERKR